MRENVAVTCDFDNANPHDPKAIVKQRSLTWRITQFREPGAPDGYSFHLHVMLENRGREAAPITLQIRWAESAYDSCRYHLYLGYDDGTDWSALPIHSEQGETECTVNVPPGRHRLCCSPPFGLEQVKSLCERAGNSDLFDLEVASTSAADRSINCLKCGDPDGVRVVITTRAHPYETAGSYCLAGWIEQAIEKPLETMRRLKGLHLNIFPCINPDGVAAGYNVLAPTGVNYGEDLACADLSDAGANELVRYIRALRPQVYLDMHNYFRLPFTDSFRCPDQRFLDHFKAFAPDMSRQQKQWEFRHYTFKDGYLPKWCAEHLGTLPMLTEFPWHLRMPDDMQHHGVLFFNALFEAIRYR